MTKLIAKGAKVASAITLKPIPAVYALYGGRGGSLYCAYPGVSRRLRQRVLQHLVLRDSTVVTDTAAAVLNGDFVTEVPWWEHPSFHERHVLEAAELVDPNDVDAMARALDMLGRDPETREDMKRKGLERARRFSWARTAVETLEVYDRVLNRGS